MMKRLIICVAEAVGIGSFVYLLFGLSGTLSNEIISVWIASGIIGISTMLHYTKLSVLSAYTIQFTVGIIAFISVSLINGWIDMNIASVLSYAGIIFVIMFIIFLAFYLISFLDSKKINEKLNGK